MLPFSSRITLKKLADLESKDEEATVAAHENRTRAWREQFKDPHLAIPAIGIEFAKENRLPGGSSWGSVSQFSEEGYSSTAAPQDAVSSESDRLAITDMENHRNLITSKTLTRRCRI